VAKRQTDSYDQIIRHLQAQQTKPSKRPLLVRWLFGSVKTLVSLLVVALWAGRRWFTQFYAAALLLLAGLVVGVQGWQITLYVCLGAAAVAGGIVGIAWRKGWLHFRAWYFAGALLAGAGWFAAVTRLSAAAPMPIILGAVTLAGSIAWWVKCRRREPEVVEPSVEIDDRIERFVAAAPGFLPAGTAMRDLQDVERDDDRDGEPDRLGWSCIIQLPKGSRETWRSIAAARANLAAIWGVPEDAIEVDLTEDRVPDRARVMVLDRRNPSHEVNYYDGSWHVLKDGCYPIGVYPDGTRSYQRLYLPKSGPVHSLFSGDSGSGKSRGMSAAITQAAMTGLCVPFVADPQGGQSIPAWAGRQGKAVWIADNEQEIRIMVDALIKLMRSRSQRLARREFLDEDGIPRVGLDYFDPEDVPELPIIDFYLDEAKDVLDDREVGDKLEKAARMFRKTGMRMTLGTQYPSIEDLGNKMGLRNQLRAGNVVSYKLGTGVGKTMVLPDWAPNPADIPEIGENGEHTKGMNFTSTSAPGGNRATFQRTTYLKNEHKWADIAAERIPELPKEDQDAMGDAWYQRWERREAYLRGDVVVDMAPRVEVEPVNQKAGDRIVEYLKEHGTTRSGVIATALDLPLPTVSKALKRLAEAGRVVPGRYGEWDAAENAAEQEESA
jgi:hypothetical protein